MYKKISIITCCFNEDKNVLSRALESIKTQDYKNTEVFVIDDSGKEHFRMLIEKKFSNFFYIPSSFRNNAKALNLGISRSNGDYIAILDGDDEWIDPKKLTLQINFLEKNRDYAALGTGVEIKYPDGKIVTKNFSDKKNITENLLHENPVCHSSVLFRRSSIEKVAKQNSKYGIMSAYDPTLKRGKDWDILLSVATIGRIGILPNICTRYYQDQREKRWRDARIGMHIVLKHRKKYPHWIRAFAIQIRRFAIFFVLEKIFGYRKA